MTDLVRHLCRPVDAASLAVVRIAFGGLMVVAMTRYFAHGWIDTMFVEPTFFFTYAGLDWIRPWPGRGMYLHFAVLAALALGIALGWRSRVCTLLFGIGFTYAHLIDKTNYLNHYHLISLLSLLLAALPVHRTMAVDVLRRPARRVRTIPFWAVLIVRAQLGLVYVFGGIAKLNGDWLLRAQPLRMWLGASTDIPLIGNVLEEPWVATATSLTGTAFDLSIVFFLVWTRTRAFAYLTVVGFHLATAVLFPIGLFPWLMIALTPVFFAPDWPRQAVAWLRGTSSPPTASGLAVPATGGRWPLAPLALYLAVQIVVPLRGWVLPGNILWTESGFRFAWRVMVMEKNGAIRFRVHDIETGERWWVDPRRELTPLQTRMMATQPDMILAYARHVAVRAQAVGHARLEVRAESYVSLNGRPSQRFVRPEVDLLRITRDASAMTWLVEPTV